MENTATRTVAAASDERLTALCAREHARCFACRPSREDGLGLQFRVQPDGSVAATWTAPSGYESYPDILHGGLIATVLDSAMVHALFARGVVARTGELEIRYRRSVSAGQIVAIRAGLRQAYPPLYHIEAEMRQGENVCARARAKFMASQTPR